MSILLPNVHSGSTPPRAHRCNSFSRGSKFGLDTARQENGFELKQEGGARAAMWLRMEAIYEQPGDYDLEHQGDDEDATFYVGLVDRWRPRRVMELASGTGRGITGFSIETWFGDYGCRRLRATSRQQIGVARKGGSPACLPKETEKI